LNPGRNDPYFRTMTDQELEAYRRMVRDVLEGDRPSGLDFDACRAGLRSGTAAGSRLEPLCMLLEGALADPTLGIDDTRTVVHLLKALARGTVSPEELLP